MAYNSKLLKAIFRVGKGRGFKVGEFVITAAHCLPYLPPCGTILDLNDRTYAKLLGQLDDAQTTIWAELTFADPISDLAILRSPDDQAPSSQADIYERLLSAAVGFTVADIEPNKKVLGKVLSLSGDWLPCVLSHRGGPLWLQEPVTVGGMSGSPILDDAGRAIGVVCSGSDGASVNCRLGHSLPRWLPWSRQRRAS